MRNKGKGKSSDRDSERVETLKRTRSQSTPRNTKNSSRSNSEAIVVHEKEIPKSTSQIESGILKKTSLAKTSKSSNGVGKRKLKDVHSSGKDKVSKNTSAQRRKRTYSRSNGTNETILAPIYTSVNKKIGVSALKDCAKVTTGDTNSDDQDKWRISGKGAKK